jgi:hypothetical protein
MDPLILEACRDRRDAWAKYEQGQEDPATRLFDARSGFGQWDLWRMVLRIFRHRNVEFLVAPYVAWAQVSILFLSSPNPSYSLLVSLPPTSPKSLYPRHIRSN